MAALLRRSAPESMALRLCDWIDAHLETFTPAIPAGVVSLREIAPVTELCMIAYALQVYGPSWQRWSRTVATRLWPKLEAYAATLPWARIAADRYAHEWMLPFVLLERLTACEFAVHALIEQTLQAPAQTLDARFVKDLAGLDDCRRQAELEVSALLTHAPAPAEVSTGWVYAVTHAMMYATALGHRRAFFPIRYAEQLGPVIAARAAQQHWDSTAELIAVLAWAGLGDGSHAYAAAQQLAALVRREGSVQSDPRVPTQAHNRFSSRYHGTLVALAALAAEGL